MPLRRTSALLGVLVLVLSLASCTPAVATTTTLSSSAATVVHGATVTLTAEVASALGTAPSGTVTFADGGMVLGARPLSGGRAVLTTSALAAGSRTVTARFDPTASGYTSSSASTTVEVQRFHLALGDSLAAGAGAPAGQGYVPRITDAMRPELPGLTLRNLSCGGATTRSMLIGGGCSYPEVTQVAAAEAFLAAHPGAVSFITIDIGANDVSGCVSSSGADPVCAANRLPVVEANLGQILDRLAAAAPGVPIVGMTYYNPFLAYWIVGNEAAAASSNAAVGTFNDALTAVYATGGALVAPVDVAFATSDFALTGTHLGVVVPQNVANICAWTRMCSNSDIHANPSGHALIAQTFLPLVVSATDS
ncbi:MAG: GDSL-type esterase/lipase family protein [Acidimicrobiales bacterium]